ncbi:hypothetical protein FGO68_gene7382 [Halteria grandinella]|uniref:Uncharacterized protein n=1 Tax=Halteria grandinella TaxID=5974 RepID=A0A8J8P967_HALGN|nr:hypothetical protein FGO68_gene7382 [Halteria grandinella]
MCASCEAGMYLMPFQYFTYYQYNPSLFRMYRVCVPDCGKTDGKFVNNPENMTCEFLGEFCQYGNYTHGCIRSLRQGEITALMHPSQTEEYFILKKYLMDKPAYYRVSQITMGYDFLNLNEQPIGGVENCFLIENENLLIDVRAWNFNSCALCNPGYYTQNTTISADGAQIGECVTTCRDGMFARVYLIGENPSYWYIYRPKVSTVRCEWCHESCFTCISQGENGCTSCKKGQRFTVIDKEIMTGSCTPLNAIDPNLKEITLYVSGDRQKAIYPDNEFPDLLSALKQAYSLHLTYFGLKTVIVTVNQYVQHYLLQNDFQKSQPLIDDSSLWNANYSITIMQKRLIIHNIRARGCNILTLSSCQVKAKIFNKLGPRFKIFVPGKGNLVFSNIQIDSIDAVLDPSDSEAAAICMNETRICCKIDSKSTLFTCRDTYGARIRPIFHKQETFSFTCAQVQQLLYQACRRRPLSPNVQGLQPHLQHN